MAHASHEPEGKSAKIMECVLTFMRDIILPPEVESEMRDCMQTGGVEGLEDYLRQNQSQWKNIDVKIGVIGVAGVGKSSFINTIRGLRPRDKGAAPTGVKQTTIEQVPYLHPDNKNLVFWDLPGVGTPEYPKVNYLEQVGFGSYDFFLILSSSRFREEDIWLGKEIVRGGKRFFYVRTKVDMDVANHKWDYGDQISDADILKEIRDDMANNLKDYPDCPIFLISSHKPQDFDFPSLTKRLIDDFPEMKREALILSLNTITTDILQRKYEVLQGRIWKATTLAASVSAVPIPGTRVAVNNAVVVKEARFYYEQLGLTDEALARAAETTHTDIKTLTDIVTDEFPDGIPTVENFVDKFCEAKHIKGISVTYISKIYKYVKHIPVVGNICDGILSYYVIRDSLDDLLTRMHNVAQNVTKACVVKSIQGIGAN